MLNPFENNQLSRAVFEEIRDLYWKQTGYDIVYSDTEGNLIYGLPNCEEFPCTESCRLARRQSVEMALRFGLPLPIRCPITYLFISVPVNLNNKVLGAFITVGKKLAATEQKTLLDNQQLQEAQETLIQIAENYNVVNRAFLEQRQKLAQTLDPAGPNPLTTPNIPKLENLWKTRCSDFLSAICNGDHQRASAIVDEVVQIIKGIDAGSLTEAKGFTLHFFSILIEHSSFENGNRNSHFLQHYQTAEKIIRSKSAANLCENLKSEVQSIFQASNASKTRDKNTIVSRLYTYIERNLGQPLVREKVASAIGISASRLSHILKEESESSFSDIVTRFRMEHARRLLITRINPISEIAAECGFCDQSHFTKVFVRTYGRSPKDYRNEFPQ